MDDSPRVAALCAGMPPGASSVRHVFRSLPIVELVYAADRLLLPLLLLLRVVEVVPGAVQLEQTLAVGAGRRW